MEANPEHPSTLIAPALAEELRRYAREAEAIKDLHDRQWDIIHREGWLNMFVPASLGGLGWSLPQVLRMEECLGWVDGSIGWVVTLCSGAGWFVGFLNPTLSRRMFSNDNVFLAGSGSVTGEASQYGEHYTVNGYWKYASGAARASYFTANCNIRREGALLREADGTPSVRAFIFAREEVTIHPTWNAMGMKATGSHSFEVKNLRVTSDRCFIIDREHVVIEEEIYRFPFLQLAETTLSVNLSGMAMRFMDCCETLIQQDDWGGTRKAALAGEINRAAETIASARRDFYRAVSASQNVATEEHANKMDLLSAKSHALAVAARRVLNALYPYTGLRSADEATELNRVWRNFNTAGQHGLFQR